MAAVTAAVLGIATSGATAVQSFVNAKKARDEASDAENAAKTFMDEARAKAEIDFFAGLTLPMDAYEYEFENRLAGQQQSIEALQEGDSRSLAAGVGKVGATQTAAGESTRIAMGEEISDLNKMKATSKEDINQQLMEMDVASAKDLNKLRRDKEKERALSITQGIEGISGVMEGANDLVALYSKKDKKDKDEDEDEDDEG